MMSAGTPVEYMILFSVLLTELCQTSNILRHIPNFADTYRPTIVLTWSARASDHGSITFEIGLIKLKYYTNQARILQ